MHIPTMEGIIDRRILVNYRVDPHYLERFLPDPFRPKLVHGMGIAGICLIRLKQIRPHSLPTLLGLSSENAAHRIAVAWEENGGYQEGVYIPRRDTSSRFNTVVGGKLFPGIHHHAHLPPKILPSFVEIEKRIGSQRKQKRSANAPGERTMRLCKNVVRVKQPPLASR